MCSPMIDSQMSRERIADESRTSRARAADESRTSREQAADKCRECVVLAQCWLADESRTSRRESRKRRGKGAGARRRAWFSLSRGGSGHVWVAVGSRSNRERVLSLLQASSGRAAKGSRAICDCVAKSAERDRVASREWVAMCRGRGVLYSRQNRELVANAPLPSRGRGL